jgi:hypothetical protein
MSAVVVVLGRIRRTSTATAHACKTGLLISCVGSMSKKPVSLFDEINPCPRAP